MGARRAAERILDGVPSAIEWYPSEDRAALLREIGRHALRHLPAKFETWLVTTTLKIFASRIHSIMSRQVANEETESGGGGGQAIYSERYVAFVDIFSFSSIVIFHPIPARSIDLHPRIYEKLRWLAIYGIQMDCQL